MYEISFSGHFCNLCRSTHVKACANSKKMRNRIAKQEALWYEEELKKEINEDRKAHGKKHLKDKNDHNQTPPSVGGWESQDTL